MLINFKVDNQKLEALDTVFLADKSQNLITCKFHFNGTDWEDKQRFALLRDNECNAYQLHIPSNNTIKIPSDLVQQEKFLISIFGEDQEETRITTNMVSFRLAASGYTTDIKDLEDVDENIWVQIFDGIDGKSDLDHKHIVDDITDFPSLSEVAYSGGYTDLLNPPTHTSNFINDGDGTKPFLTEHQDITGKVDKIPGKGLSTEDFTTNEKTKLTGIDVGANKYIHPNTHPATMITGLARVANTGKYNDLIDTPNIPTVDNTTISLVNNVLSVKNNSINENKLSANVNALLGYADNWNKSAAKNITANDLVYWNSKQDNHLVTTLVNASNNTYPSSKAVKDYVDGLIGDISEYVNR